MIIFYQESKLHKLRIKEMIVWQILVIIYVVMFWGNIKVMEGQV